MHETIIILDFGSQVTQLIARRVREADVYCEILSCHAPLDVVKAKNPKGIILSGGPASVYVPGAPQVDPALRHRLVQHLARDPVLDHVAQRFVAGPVGNLLGGKMQEALDTVRSNYKHLKEVLD